jgi:hypothetical protein
MTVRARSRAGASCEPRSRDSQQQQPAGDELTPTHVPILPQQGTTSAINDAGLSAGVGLGLGRLGIFERGVRLLEVVRSLK